MIIATVRFEAASGFCLKVSTYLFDEQKNCLLVKCDSKIVKAQLIHVMSLHVWGCTVNSLGLLWHVQRWINIFSRRSATEYVPLFVTSIRRIWPGTGGFLLNFGVYYATRAMPQAYDRYDVGENPKLFEIWRPGSISISTYFNCGASDVPCSLWKVHGQVVKDWVHTCLRLGVPFGWSYPTIFITCFCSAGISFDFGRSESIFLEIFWDLNVLTLVSWAAPMACSFQPQICHGRSMPSSLQSQRLAAFCTLVGILSESFWYFLMY